MTAQTSHIIIRQVTAAETRPLRHALLRPQQPPEELVYPGDDAPGNFHLGLLLDDRLIGVVSMFCQSPPGKSLEDAWQLRGMAVEPMDQRLGFGSLILEQALEEAHNWGGRLIWCNARESAVGFYRRHGFTVESDVFEIPGIGSHYVMMFHPL